MPDQPITLVLNADDFGLSKGINRGIAACCERGILRSASLMANGSTFDDALRIIRYLPEMGIGIHLSLVGEYCVASPHLLGKLVDGHGRLPPSYPSFLSGYLRGRYKLSQIRTELEAQVQRVLDAGVKPTHLDSHQHLHLLPGIFELVLEIAHAVGIRVIRIPRECHGLPAHCSTTRAVMLRGLNLLSLRAARQAQRAGLRIVDHFWGLGVSGRLTEPVLLQLLQRLSPAVNEIMCHPGYGDPATRQHYPWDYDWDAEAAALRAAAVSRAITERGIRVASFADAWYDATDHSPASGSLR